MRPIHLLLSLAAILLLGARTDVQAKRPAKSEVPSASPNTKPIKRVKIAAIQLSVTNGSLAPKYRSERRWTLRADSTKGWPKLVKQLLDGTTINGVATLREFISLRDDGETIKLAAIEAKTPDRKTAKGGSTRTLSLFDGATLVFQFDSSRDYGGAGLRSVYDRLYKDGIHIEIGPGELPTPP